MAGTITHYTYDLMSATLLAELPFTGPAWSQQLNAAGQWSGSLNLADPKVQNLNALTGTRPGRTLLIVDVDGAIAWGGIVWTRQFNSVSRILTVAGSEAFSYFSHRLQAADYTVPPTGGPGYAYWSANPQSADYIGAAIIADALGKAGSAFSTMALVIAETIGNVNPITETWPATQLQAIDSMINSVSGGGYLTGFDFSIDWQWSAGQGSTPVPTMTFAYPRRGRVAGTTGLIIDANAPGASYQWDEDASGQTGNLYGTASGAGGLTTVASDPSPITAGGPLLESYASYSLVGSQSSLNAAAQGDLARLEWPVVAPQVTLPMFGTTLSIGDFLLGDDAQLLIDPDERFPQGLNTYLRITGLNANPADAGQSLMTLTLGLPPALAPVGAPPS